MPTLFDPLKLGALTLPNRIVMAPLDPQPRHAGRPRAHAICRRTITASAPAPA